MFRIPRGLIPSLMLWSGLAQGKSEPVIFDPVDVYYPRSDSVGEAGTVLEDTVMAPLINPAGVGGIHWESSPGIGKLNFPFPYVGGFSTDPKVHNSSKFMDYFLNPSLIGKEGFLGENPEESFLIRRSIMANVVVKRFQFSAFTNEEVVALKGEDNEPALESGQWNLWYKKSQGTLVGLAIPLGRAGNIGISGGSVQMGLGKKQFATVDEIVTDATDGGLFQDGLHRYQGAFLNVGIHFRPVLRKNSFVPSFSINVRDLGGTTLARTKKPETEEDFVYTTPYERTEGVDFFRPQNTAIGLGLSSPGLAGFFFPHLTVGVQQLGNPDVELADEVSGGLEIDLGEPGDGAPIRISSGFSKRSRGVSVILDLGLIGAVAGVKQYQVHNREFTRSGFLVFTDLANITTSKGKKYLSKRRSFSFGNFIPKIFLH